MKLSEALAICATPPANPEGAVSLSLVCGFTPLHLKTFLHAELQRRFPSNQIAILTGTYGDIFGALQGLRSDAPAIVIIEWSDLDPRLGFRQLGGWKKDLLPDIQVQVSARLRSLHGALLEAAGSREIAVSPPSLPLPPLFPPPTSTIGPVELGLRESVADFASLLAANGRIRVLNSNRPDEKSPHCQRYDARMDLMSGFPYQVAYASALAEATVEVLFRPLPKKGLITDLDNTLWNGVLGNDGISGISWDLDGKAQVHGIYQQFLSSLASIGVLIGVASKNDPELVAEAFGRRRDLLIGNDDIFPIAASWSSKADSIADILRTWNIGADSVVFVDDDPSELAEVTRAFPEMPCLRFPHDDPGAALDLLYSLRDHFGRSIIQPEDSLRLASLRKAAPLQLASTGDGFSDALLVSANAKIRLIDLRGGFDERAYELLNKTNQFNLNGKRVTRNEFHAFSSSADGICLAVEYEDRFGPSGKIAVVLGKRGGRVLHIDSWVMSCRVFSRRIEHQVLRHIFTDVDDSVIELDYRPTEKNGPMRRFLAELGGDFKVTPVRLSREQFDSKCPTLYHQVTIERLQ